MAHVSGDFPHFTSPNNRGYFSLNADQDFNFQTWHAPVHWTGHVNDIEVSFVQIHDSGSSRYNYDFSGFPPKAAQAIDHIIKAIDDAMRVMD